MLNITMKGLLVELWGCIRSFKSFEAHVRIDQDF